MGLRFSTAVGGGGDVSFDTTSEAMNSRGAWDSVAVVELLDGSTWRPAGAYAIRLPHTFARTGKTQVQVRGISVLEQWAAETVLLPEYGAGTMPRGAGEERALGWQGTAYDPMMDTDEPWAGCYNTARTALPPNFPTGTGAKWISVTGASDTSERKLFRSWLTISGGTQLVRIFLSSDESCTLYVAGEPVLETSSVEEGYKEFSKVDLVLHPGEFAIAADTATDFSKGGDGIDPIIVAIGIVNDSGGVSSWPLVTDAYGSGRSAWVACRRDDEFPGEQAPGPNPGKLLQYLFWEAQNRSAAFGLLTFDESLQLADSYGVDWPGIIVERQFRYGSDSYQSILSALAETNEVDVWAEWQGPGAAVRAAPVQGHNVSAAVSLGTSTVQTMSSTQGTGPGTWLVGLSHFGWHFGGLGGPRREYMIELGTARSPAVAHRIGVASLAEDGRWDASARVLAVPGAIPMLDYSPGDTIGLNYPDAPSSARVLSISAEVGEAAMLFDLELTEAGK
jgi:hypothetical protein